MTSFARVPAAPVGGAARVGAARHPLVVGGADEPKDTAGEPKDTVGAEPPANARGGGRTVHLITASHGGDLLRWTLDVHELVGSNGAGHVTNAGVAMDKFGPNDKAHARTVFTIPRQARRRGDHVAGQERERVGRG